MRAGDGAPRAPAQLPPGSRRLGVDLDGADRPREALGALQAPQPVAYAVEVARQMHDAVAGQHLAGLRDRAQPRRAVECAAVEVVGLPDGLAGVDPDTDRAGEVLLGDPPLQIERIPQRSARGREHDHRLVAPVLGLGAAVLAHERLDDG